MVPKKSKYHTLYITKSVNVMYADARLAKHLVYQLLGLDQNWHWKLFTPNPVHNLLPHPVEKSDY